MATNEQKAYRFYLPIIHTVSYLFARFHELFESKDVLSLHS